MWLITEAKYATLVDVLAARRPINVHPCPAHLPSALKLIDLGTWGHDICAAVIW